MKVRKIELADDDHFVLEHKNKTVEFGQGTLNISSKVGNLMLKVDGTPMGPALDVEVKER